ncbi:unannotated protein [freshwater metagenome]|uniref:Unannotated protein n=1 Tax=freshwater metagenome TaxID=449393 RepID=A0A6J7DAG2_9ZZZZ|nr:DUF1905 domain-containing protein [Actinomycetota bacterium]
MRLNFVSDMFEWRGPSPFYFVGVPDDESQMIRDLASMVTYGWGVIPVTATIGSSTVTTSLFPKDGGYLVPIKNAVRLPEKIAVGDSVHVTLSIGV